MNQDTYLKVMREFQAEHNLPDVTAFYLERYQQGLQLVGITDAEVLRNLLRESHAFQYEGWPPPKLLYLLHRVGPDEAEFTHGYKRKGLQA